MISNKQYKNGELVDKPEAERNAQQIESDANAAQKIIDDVNNEAKRKLMELDMKSIRDMREWIAAQADAPQTLKDREQQAKNERAKIK